MNDIITLARENGFEHIARANVGVLVPRREVRDMCSADRCKMYGKTWSCPPACGTIEHAAQQIAQYDSCLLVQSTAAIADELDYTGMVRACDEHRRRFLNFIRQVRRLEHDCLPLGAGPCRLCRKCTYPQKPCRYPAKRICSMEAYGLLVAEVCKSAGLCYNYGPSAITYTSCVLYNEE